MTDQADALRRLVHARAGPSPASDLEPEAEAPSPAQEQAQRRARLLLLTSGKGGVGTSNLALNLAVAMGLAGHRVVLVDADPGLANIDLLCGLSPPSDLGDVLASGRPMADAIVEGPGSIRVVAGAHAMRASDDTLAGVSARLVNEMASLAADADFVIVDAGSGLGPADSELVEIADEILVIATPEPTALADALAVVARLRQRENHGRPAIRTVINLARSNAEAIDALDHLTHAGRAFLGAVVRPLGFVRLDARVPVAVRNRRPFVIAVPGGLASKGVTRLATALIAHHRPRSGRSRWAVWNHRPSPATAFN